MVIFISESRQIQFRWGQLTALLRFLAVSMVDRKAVNWEGTARRKASIGDGKEGKKAGSGGGNPPLELGV